MTSPNWSRIRRCGASRGSPSRRPRISRAPSGTPKTVCDHGVGHLALAIAPNLTARAGTAPSRPSKSLPRPAREPDLTLNSGGYPLLRYFLQGPLCARWKVGDLGMGLVTGNWISPFASGSGKFGTPLARMHLASAISSRRTLAGVEGECPDWGKYFWQASNALRAAGGWRLMSLPESVLDSPGPGSGKFGTPLARMHRENRSAETFVALIEAPLLVAVDAQPVILAAPSTAVTIRSNRRQER